MRNSPFLYGYIRQFFLSFDRRLIVMTLNQIATVASDRCIIGLHLPRRKNRELYGLDFLIFASHFYY
jgi:hypothetical protein